MHSRADAPKSNPTCTILIFFSLKLKRLGLLWTEISRDREVSCKKSEMSCESHWEENVNLADGNKWRPINNNDNQKHHSLGWRNLSSWLLTVSYSLYSSNLIHARLCSLLFTVYNVLIGSCSVLMTLVILVYTYLIVVCVSFDLLFFSCIKHFALP